MRKARTTEQKQTEQKPKASGATAPVGAPAGPEEPPVRSATGEAPATGGQAPAAGNPSCEATNTPDAPSEAGPADKPADSCAKGACLACGKQFHVPENLRRRNARRGWPPQVRCHPYKLANDAHYAALGNTAPATAVASDAKFRAAFPAALVTSDGEIPDGDLR